MSHGVHGRVDFTDAKALVSGKQLGGLALSEDGSRLAFGMAGSIWVRDLASGNLVQLAVPGKLQPVGGSGGYVEWSPSGCRFAFAFRDNENYNQIGIAKVTGIVASGVQTNSSVTPHSTASNSSSADPGSSTGVSATSHRMAAHSRPRCRLSGSPLSTSPSTTLVGG